MWVHDRPYCSRRLETRKCLFRCVNHRYVNFLATVAACPLASLSLSLSVHSGVQVSLALQSSPRILLISRNGQRFSSWDARDGHTSRAHPVSHRPLRATLPRPHTCRHGPTRVVHMRQTDVRSARLQSSAGRGHCCLHIAPAAAAAAAVAAAAATFGGEQQRGMGTA